MMPVTFTAVSAVMPSLLLMWYFHARDLYPEPPKVLWATFGLGLLCVIPVLAFALPASRLLSSSSSPYVGGLQQAFFMAAIPEELCKFLVVLLYCSRHKEFNEPMDGVVYGVVASLGFATLENILYVASGGLKVAFLRALTAVPSHAFLGAIMGYYVGQARFSVGHRSALLLGGLALPTLLHGLYDFPLLTLQAMANGRDRRDDNPVIGLALVLMTILILIFEWRWVVRITRRLRAEQQRSVGVPPTGSAASEADATAIPTPAASTRRSRWRWVYTLLGALLATGGGLMTLGLAVSIAQGTVQDKDLAAIVIAGIVIGVLPLSLGLYLFAMGVRRFNQPLAG